MFDSISVTLQSNLECAFKLKLRHQLNPSVMMSAVVLVTELAGAQMWASDESTVVLSARHVQWSELTNSTSFVPQALVTTKTATSSTIAMCSLILARYFAYFLSVVKSNSNIRMANVSTICLAILASAMKATLLMKPVPSASVRL